MPLEIYLFAYNDDNYGALVHDPATGATAAVDAGVAADYQAALQQQGWQLSEIWVTHHHWDHIDGLAELKASTGATVRGPAGIEGVDIVLGDEDSFTFADEQIKLLHTPGHTMDMLNYYLPKTGAVFTGDTLFTLGCGRLFEGTPADMWTSMQKLLRLPDDTMVYGAHEYTLANASFALSVDPDNADLIARVAEVKALRAKDLPTVPSVLQMEKATNPFLRPADGAIRAHLDMAAASDAEVFAEIRRRKDNF